MVSLSWIGCLVLSTLQKLGPIFVLMKSAYVRYFLMFFRRRISILLSGVLGLNQLFLRTLLAYSSISHTGWILSILPYRFFRVYIYLSFYFLFSLSLFYLLNKLNFDTVIRSQKNVREVFLVGSILLVLSGIPPFSFFFLKVTVLMLMVSYPLFVILILIGSMLSVYFYLNFFVTKLLKVLYFNGLNKVSRVLTVFIFLVRVSGWLFSF